MRVYIQQYEKQFMEEQHFAAYLGFRETGVEIRFFENINDIRFNKEYIVIAYIEDTIKYLKSCGISIPAPLNIPFNLNDPFYLGRDVKIKSVKQFKNEDNYPIFAKPYTNVKKFNSGVIKSKIEKDSRLSEMPDNELIMTSNVVNILSEWRGFVHNNKLVGLKHYTGSEVKFPDPFFIKKAIEMNVGAPVAYTMDFGVIDKQYEHPDTETIVIECNDFWSIDNYGLNPTIYSNMLKDRWFEILNNGW